MCREMATEATFFGQFHKLIHILIAWSIISTLVFNRAVDMTSISFIPIQLGAMKTLCLIKSLLPVEKESVKLFTYLIKCGHKAEWYLKVH